MTAIIGRKEEQRILQEVFESSESQFLAVYGRRRIGKTYLINEFFKDKGVYFEVTGMKDGLMKEQLFQFGYEFSRKFNHGREIATPKSWMEALVILHGAIENVEDGKKIILFFDEIPWLASPRSNFLNTLTHFWNRYFSRNKNIILVTCGSSASWIIRNIINNKGGLHGRITRKIQLLPFTLSETESYLKSRSINLDRKQVIDLYMVLGGVPKYLSYVTRGKSAASNINDICFSRNGELNGEFKNLYRSLFDNYDHYISVVKALACTTAGLTKKEVLAKTNLSSGGGFSKIIEGLKDAGFIIYVPSFHQRKTGGVYKLIDEFSLFYLTWMNEQLNISLEGVDSEFWIKKQASSKWKAWSGLAFESICFKHIGKIKSALGISGICSAESSWRYRGEKKEKLKGAQIDLVIDRDDKCMNLCEMKYSDSEYVLNKVEGDKLRDRKGIFRNQSATKKTLFTTMVTTYGVKKNQHFLSVVDSQITMDAMF